MTPAKITGFSIADFKRVRLVEIRPSENGLTILGGRNAQGKSSCLDAIAYALGGEMFRPTDVNNHEGEKNAAIRVEIDGLIVERSGKNAALKITDARGMRGNQTLLNDIVGKFALDLGSFMRASENEKTKLLLKMFPDLEKKLAEIKTSADAIRADRADLNRDIKKLQFQYDDMPFFPGLPESEIGAGELMEKLAVAHADERELLEKENHLKETSAKLAESGNLILAAEKNLQDARNELIDFENSIEVRRNELKRKIEDAQDSISGLLQDRETVRNDYSALMADVEARRRAVEGVSAGIQEEISGIDEKNFRIRKNLEKKAMFERLSELRNISAKKTEDLEELDRNRMVVLQEAELPLPELSITDDGDLLYRGMKWDCMSGAERLKVATSICMKSKPGCGFVLIDGLEAMDPQTLAEFSEYLALNNMQGIGTIVGETSATVIIEDGKIKNGDSPEEPNN